MIRKSASPKKNRSNQDRTKKPDRQKRRSDSGRNRGEKESKKEKSKKSGFWWGIGDILTFLVDIFSIFG